MLVCSAVLGSTNRARPGKIQPHGPPQLGTGVRKRVNATSVGHAVATVAVLVAASQVDSAQAYPCLSDAQCHHQGCTQHFVLVV